MGKQLLKKDGFYNFYRSVEEKSSFNVNVSLKTEKYFGTADITLEVVPFRFTDPLTSNYSFPESPVISRGDDQFIDPGSVFYHDGKSHCFYNAIYKSPYLYGGYAISSNGLNWERVAGHDNPLFTRKDIEKSTGTLPSDFHMKSVIYDNGNWVAYFTAVSTRVPFYGQIFRVISSDPLGPWVIDEKAVLIASPDNWEKGHIGLPQVFKIDDNYYMFYSSEEGDVGFAVSSDGISWIKNPEPVTKADRPCIGRLESGWIMISDNTIYLSSDGTNWHSYYNPLFTGQDLKNLNISNLWINTILIINDRFYYFFEGGSNATGSNIYLINWDS